MDDCVRFVELIQQSEDAITPSYFNDYATGADLYSTVDALIKSKSHIVIDTGISLRVPAGYDLQIRSRSGLAAKHGVIVLNSPGTIDCDYRDTIKIILANLGSQDYEVKKGHRIAQLVLTKFYRMNFVYSYNNSTPKPRMGGLGSTGQ